VELAYVQDLILHLLQLASCESIGLGDKGFTVATGTTPLTPVQEVAYSLSTNGSAASAYNTARGLASGAYVASCWRRC
jgi:hypothetical protein